MNAETLRAIIANPATPPSDREAAITALRAVPQSGALSPECRPASAMDGLAAELLRATGASDLADVPLNGLLTFCRERGWTSDVERLYEASIRAGAIQSWQRYLDDGFDDPKFTKAAFACYNETPSREAAIRIINNLKSEGDDAW